MSLSGGLEYLRDAVFNYPTLAEGYKIAALDGFDRLAQR
jgi:NAD(P) transhydrogenase